MSSSPSPYMSVVSAKSRRLRTIGAVLLFFIVAMTLYGYFGLMPTMSRGIPQTAIGVAQPNVAPLTGRAKRVAKVKAASVIAYWGVCFLLMSLLLFIVWLDVREISATYALQRRALWAQKTEEETDRNRDG